MKNIHILKTDKPSRLYEGVNKELKFTDHPITNKRISCQHIYITSDEEIKDGDWMIRDNEQPIKVTEDFFWDFGVRYYKIILTTDQNLIANGIQAIDDDFLEWFIKNPSCEHIDIYNDKSVGYEYDHYSVIIPQKEPKQERMYSEEDMAEAFIACWKVNVPNGIECKVSFNEWFEQFKKK